MPGKRRIGGFKRKKARKRKASRVAPPEPEIEIPPTPDHWPTCKHIDRHSKKAICGYPLPCPYHTAVIDLTQEPAKIQIPVTATAALRGRGRLGEITAVLSKGAKDA